LETEELIPMNNLDGTTKLEWALQIAESVALLHNHEKGVIVHGALKTGVGRVIILHHCSLFW